MVTAELIKAEIDKVPGEYLEILYKIIKAFETSPKTKVDNMKATTNTIEENNKKDWLKFIEGTYGCLADDPIERGDQGSYEIREVIL